MMIPLPKTIRGSKVLPKQTEYLLNLMNTGEWIISRPACELVTAKAGDNRGTFTFAGELFSVFGQKLCLGPALAEIGTIPGIDQIRFAGGFQQGALVCANGNFKLQGGGLTPIASLPACRDVTFIDGRFLYVPLDGGPVLYSDVNDAAAVQPLSFVDAESQPDLNRGIENIRNDIFVFGETSIERFRNIGPVTSPFVRVTNSVISVGLVGGKILTKDSCLFLGRDKENGYCIFLLSEGTATPVSSPTINELLNTEYTLAQLQAMTVQRFNWRGADCYAFSLYDRTFLFQNGSWSYLSAGIPGLLNLGVWPYVGAVLFGDTWYVQGQDGLNKLTAGIEDSVGKFSRQIVTFARSKDEEVLTFGYAELGVANGVGEAAVGLSISKNGQLWSPPYYRSMQAVGNYDERLRWQPAGGLGRFDGYMGLRFYTTAAVDFAVDSLVLQ